MSLNDYYDYSRKEQLMTVEETGQQVGKFRFYRFRLDDMRSFGEVHVLGWSKDKAHAYTKQGEFVDVGELFDSEKDAVEFAIRHLRDEEQRLYNERRALEARLDEIEEAKVKAGE